MYYRDAALAERSSHDARLRVYRLNPEPLAALRAWLDQLDAFWGEQLNSFKRHTAKRADAKRAEAKRRRR